MASWTVVPCLDALRGEFNALNPNRDKASDGSIGDTNHSSSSDHTPDEDSKVLRDHDPDSKNEVHARDIDKDGPWPNGLSFHTLVMRVIDGERKKWRDPNDKCRLNYVIWNGKIYDKDNDFQPETYTGSNPHDKHAHFSARYETSCENDTRPWGVATEVDDVSEAEVTSALTKFFAVSKQSNGYPESKIGHDASSQGVPNTVTGGTTNLYGLLGLIGTRVVSIEKAVTALAGQDPVNEEAIIEGVLAGLAGADGAAETIADAVVAALPEDLATDVANQILAKQGQAMVDASEPPTGG